MNKDEQGCCGAGGGEAGGEYNHGWTPIDTDAVRQGGEGQGIGCASKTREALLECVYL